MDLISEQPWYFTLLCFLAGFLYAFFLYRNEKAKQSFSNPLLYSLFGFRFVSVTLIALLLMGFFIKRVVNQTEKPLILVAMDNSASVVSGKDSARVRSSLVSDLDALTKSLSEKYSVQPLLFGHEVTNNSKPDFSGKETDLSQLLRETDNNFSNRNIGAMVIFSDGIINRGANPLPSIEKLKYPVYTVALGDTTVRKDLFIRKINNNQVVYLGNKFPVEVVIQGLKLKGKASTVSIFHGGAKKAEQVVNISNDNFTQTLNFVLEADKPGPQKYTVELHAAEGETNLQNNSQSFLVDVIDTREKVLILAQAPHPDVAALKESIESNPAYEVDAAVASDFNKPLKPYSLVIFHNMLLSANRFMNELNTNGQSFLLVHPQLGDNLPGVKMATSYNKLNETEAVLNKNFTLFSLSDELKKFINDVPAVNSFFANYNVSAGVNSLLFQKIGVVETENPLLAFSNNSGQKSALFFGDGLWRWRLRDYAEHDNHHLFDELIGKTVQYLSVKADKSFFRLFTKKIINENESVEFNAEVYNKSYQLITDPEVNILMTDEAGKQYNYTMSKNNVSYFLDAGLFPPGEYKYKASVKADGELYTQSGLITIKAIVAEKTNTVADHTLLFQMSKASGGKLFYPAQLKELEQALLNNELIKPVTYSQKQLSDLIDLKWIFFLILALLSVEWFLRKRNGTV